MEFTPEIQDFLVGSTAKALATYGNDGLNVVPVSSVKVVDGKIWLINYFMDKTLKNILEGDGSVALTFWNGLSGYQVKGSVVHYDSGELFEEAKKWIAGELPDRVVKGLLVLTPAQVFDISVR